MAVIRTFIAIPLAPRLIPPMRVLLSELRACEPGIKWTRPENLHFTLVFLGEIQEERINVLHRVCQSVAATHSRFSIQCGHLGAFPGQGHPRVIWLGLTQGAEEMAAIQKQLAVSLSTAGFVFEDKPFVPHLTLGRVRGKGPLCSWRQVQTIAYPGETSMQVEALMIMRSDLKPDGAHYTVLHCCPLG